MTRQGFIAGIAGLLAAPFVGHGEPDKLHRLYYNEEHDLFVDGILSVGDEIPLQGFDTVFTVTGIDHDADPDFVLFTV